MTVTIATGLATREGTAQDNADAARVYRMSTGAVGAAVIDGIGHGPHTSRTAPLLAETAARITAHRGALAGILSAGLLIADDGHDGEEADGVGVAVLVDDAGARAAWVGDCDVFGWDGARLRRYSTPQVMGEWVRQYGPPVEIAARYDGWVRVSLHTATVATVGEVDIPDEVVLLLSDGAHGQVPASVMEGLVREHHDNPQALAEAIVAAAQPDAAGYRDDATAIVIRTRVAP
ncbi:MULTISPECIES: hypothetical protein [Streptomyces]|uniref:hypothetical protein n=1 Tax=Streptomyces TaxID=1883 RepID=UPI00104041F7|nr:MULTISPECIES: hypothetical protein [Streptomyces]MBT3085372.1 hypothetical protein [Streptomyces sp. CYG21]MBT3111274.1 hypothetical protein [Streptomyces sp. CYG20]MBT3077619.1 hypothetical protein [Streptomyces sp. COG21]MBT3084465.1 hypothetical protein [Streptomyces sp. COG20]MBT3098964.1 hypothetical protein [Streptomyces sp. CBG30]